jgi:hypothetical protein
MMVQAASSGTPANLPADLLEEPPSTPAVERQIKELIVNEAFKHEFDPQLGLKIARCESQFRQVDVKTGEVLRGVHNPKDAGVFQINETFHLEDSKKLGFDIYTLEGNVGYAMYLLKKDGPRHWNWSKPCWGK